jgi:hypothetical protein
VRDRTEALSSGFVVLCAVPDERLLAKEMPFRQAGEDERGISQRKEASSGGWMLEPIMTDDEEVNQPSEPK